MNRKAFSVLKSSESNDILYSIGGVVVLDKNDLQAIAELLKPIYTSLDTVDTRLGSVDNRLDTVDTKLGSVGNRLDTVDTRLGSVDSRLDTVDTRLDSIQNRLDTVDTRLGSIEERLSNVEEDAKVTRGAVNKLIEWADDASIQDIPLFKKAK